MALFHIFYLFCIGTVFVKCAPAPDTTSLYDAIVAKCSSVVKWTNFKEQPFLQACSNWEKINQTQVLTDNTKINVLCLLYYTSFTRYCSRSTKKNFTLPTVNNVDLKITCDTLDVVILKQLGTNATLSKIITSKDECKKLCNDGVYNVMPMCSKSYYYSRLLETEEAESHMILDPQIKKVDPFLPVPAGKQNHSPLPLQPAVPEENPVKEKEKTGDTKPQILKEEETTVHKESLADNNIQDPPQENAQPPQSGGGQISEVSNSMGSATNVKSDTKSDNKEINKADTTKSNTQEVKNEVKNEQKPAPPTMPTKNEDTIQVDSNPNIHLDKNTKLMDGGDLGNDYGGNDNVNQPNTDHESEEELEDSVNDKAPKQVKMGESDAANFTTEMDGDSYFFTYFMLLCIIFIVGYVCYHNKQKILALILEGRRGKRQYRGRRPNSANYHKLDSNLEEAMTSSCNKNTNNVIY